MSATTHDSSKNYINHESGIMSWLTTLDHKRIGLLYMIAVMLFFFIYNRDFPFTFVELFIEVVSHHCSGCTGT